MISARVPAVSGAEPAGCETASETSAADPTSSEGLRWSEVTCPRGGSGIGRVVQVIASRTAMMSDSAAPSAHAAIAPPTSPEPRALAKAKVKRTSLSRDVCPRTLRRGRPASTDRCARTPRRAWLRPPPICTDGRAAIAPLVRHRTRRARQLPRPDATHADKGRKHAQAEGAAAGGDDLLRFQWHRTECWYMRYAVKPQSVTGAYEGRPARGLRRPRDGK